MAANDPIDRDRLLRWLTEASRAPSPHNIQPARWRFEGNCIELHEACDRWLDVGDPTGRDNRIGLGMAWEALVLAMSRDGVGLSAPTLEPMRYPAPSGQTFRCVASATLRADVAADPLAPWQHRRRCWRGPFPVADEAAVRRLQETLAAHSMIATSISASHTNAIATLHDEATLALARDLDFAVELYRWMRFAGFGKRWHRDGLSTTCLGIPMPVGWIAAALMHPTVQPVLARIGVLGAMLSERKQVVSATALVAIQGAVDADAFDIGRSWYRFWLALTEAGFAAVPMSAVADEPSVRDRLLALLDLPAGRRLFNVMRVGPMPAREMPQSARLPIAELLL